MPRKPSILETIRERDVYKPEEPLPPPGYRQPFFAPGGIVGLLTLVAVFALIVWLQVTGGYAAIAAAIHPVTKGLADMTRAIFGL